jgi:REP element-mobilizing transposase RayT
MPDHVHIVSSATREHADLRKFVSSWKQRSGYEHKQRTGALLWQPSYFDHVLRDDEETWRAVRYILENPVRKGLVQNLSDYPFSGSDVYTLEQLADAWRDRQG